MTHLSSWSQEAIAAYFWEMVKVGADRLALLQQLAAVAVQRPDAWSTADVRLESYESRSCRPTQCFCCYSGERRLYWHHIVGVSHGGDNSPTNQVPVCLKCHATIHPWLKAEEPRTQIRGWSSVAEIARDAFKVDKESAA